MFSLVLATLLHLTPPARPPKHSPPPQSLIFLPPSKDALNFMFVADKGGKFKILSPPAFSKELRKCIVLRVDFYEASIGEVLVLRCEESQ